MSSPSATKPELHGLLTLRYACHHWRWEERLVHWLWSSGQTKQKREEKKLPLFVILFSATGAGSEQVLSHLLQALKWGEGTVSAHIHIHTFTHSHLAMCPERFSIMGTGLPTAVPAPTATPAGVPSTTHQPPAFPLGFASPPTPTAQQATNPQPTYHLGFK